MKTQNHISKKTTLYDLVSHAFVILLISALLIGGKFAYADSSVTLIYPVYHNDTDRIISEIREGLHASQKNNISEIAFDTVDLSGEAQKRIRSLSDDVIVITLTNDLEDVIRASGFKGQLIDGVSGNQAKRKSTISVGIDTSPLVYIDTLDKLNPQIKKITYFTSTSKNNSDPNLINKASNTNHAAVEIVNVESIDDAMRKINDTIAHNDPSETAIWLPNRVLSMSNNTVLKYVLREAWRKSFTVFTDSIEAVARGLLFSLLPDYRAYGEYLGNMASSISAGDDPPVSDSIRYFDDVYLMLNQRFSVHLGLNINRSLFEKYKIVVPAK